ncbi:efflux RND transporter periplasmic adaptor subunit [Suttonella sp. R2A3]|uniref:efflux RND transporter periplasmic adaptor subunit n=1 Tax=Suttonella sp. R2A3 TaxID=2908648 RepID=UPI001F1A334E|nr:efflux RND transporter periplasmic adaptor subunit [Suttonella sp. R2A3]UJF23780.1 efflux RND transporter periplasmic adaptor subunit [Suttonella sp. R2A3]
MFQAGISKKSMLVVLFIVAVLGLGWWYYSEQRAAKEVTPYLTEKVTRGDIAAKVSATGSLEALKQVDVGAQVSGEISALYVEIGDEVKAGDRIAEIDASTQINSQNTARAQLQSREAELLTAQANLRQAQQNYDRQKALLARGAVAKEVLEQANTALQSATSAVEQAKAGIQQSQIDVNTAGLNLGYTSVNAPIDGTVIAVVVEKGQTVNAVQNVPTLVKIAQTDHMRVKAEISEADVSRVSTGMPAYFTLLGDSKRFNGTLASIDPAPLHVSNNTSASETAVYYYGKMDVANPEQLLRIGMTANVHIITNQAKNVLLIPLTAVREGDEGASSVQVMVDGKPQAQAITTGIDDGIRVQVIDGLQEGDEVVVSEGGGEAFDLGRGGPF